MPPTTCHLTAYEKWIAEATGASDSLLPILENIMREEVFHSTLDWQSNEPFTAGARQALRTYLHNRRLYETESAFHQAWALRLQAEQTLAAAQATGDPSAIRVATGALVTAKSEEVATLQAFDACLGLGG